jgi:hypothetical protein
VVFPMLGIRRLEGIQGDDWWGVCHAVRL